MGFDDWLIDNCNPVYPSARQAFKAGAASRQGEVDELKNCIEGWKSEYNAMCKRFERSQEFNKELQKRIDEAVDYLKGESDDFYKGHLFCDSYRNPER